MTRPSDVRVAIGESFLQSYTNVKNEAKNEGVNRMQHRPKIVQTKRWSGPPSNLLLVFEPHALKLLELLTIGHID
jgi:hypothetical protein